MKKTTIFLMGICCTVFMWATGNSTYFYNNDGHLLSFNDADIDSIAFSKVDTNGVEQENVVTQIIYAGDSTYHIPLGQVDSITFTPRIQQNDEYGITIGQEIDLGLPSGTKWASWNVGASSPEEYGDYYAWGETEEKSDYSKYKLWVDSDGNGCVDSGEMANIGSNISGTQYDVASKKWGGSWRMPTKAEFDELTSKCTWTWCQYKGINGYKVTGSNGNSIFLPAAGVYNDTYHYDGYNGRYWSASLNEDKYDGCFAWNLCLFYDYRINYNVYHCRSTNSRVVGFTVRPVK